MYYPDYLIHYNKNHSPKNGQFTSGDGDGDGISNDHAHRSKNPRKKKGQYSAKIENYHKGTLFQDAYYIDKRGNKRSYMSYKEMPVEAQNKERAKAKAKSLTKEYGGMALRTAATTGVQMAARAFLGF